MPFALIGLCLSGFSQSAGDYRTTSTGNWDGNIWQRYNGSTWVATTSYPGESAGTGMVTIRHAVTFSVNPANPVGGLTIEANLSSNQNDAVLNITGNLVISAGTLNCTNNGNRELTIYVGGSFTMSGGTITENGNYGEIIFNGSGTQALSKTGGTISNDIRFTVSSGSVLSLGSSVLDGSAGSFTLSDGAGLITAHTQGISSF
ncbi:hypothetical protein EG830_15045, partial [bacterium]|nr:hypothetical protein [bacterium]